MEKEKIADLIRKKRKEKGMTQEALAQKLFVTEKAISRWETAKGTPDISLLIPLANELGLDVSELLSGEEAPVIEVIHYEEEKRKQPKGLLRLIFGMYALSILIFLIYLRIEYDPSVASNYFLNLGLMVFSSVLIIAGNRIYADHLVEKLEDKARVKRLSEIIVFVYYVIMMFNMTGFARFGAFSGVNLIPFRSIMSTFATRQPYSIIVFALGNFVIFMPLQFFIMDLMKIDKMPLNFIVCLIVIILIEASQLFFKVGVFDVDDIILNVAGMMVFFLLAKKILPTVVYQPTPE